MQLSAGEMPTMRVGSRSASGPRRGQPAGMRVDAGWAARTRKRGHTLEGVTYPVGLSGVHEGAGGNQKRLRDGCSVQRKRGIHESGDAWSTRTSLGPLPLPPRRAPPNPPDPHMHWTVACAGQDELAAGPLGDYAHGRMGRRSCGLDSTHP
eukprot:scaffold2408_cov28-Tisochrysis_lutea.AAC.1